MKINNVADFNEMVLRGEGNWYGFEVEQVSYSKFYEIRSKYVNFTVLEDYSKSDWQNRIMRCSLTIKASISTMGGNPTVEELMKAGEDIRNAARLMEKINGMDIVIEERI